MKQAIIDARDTPAHRYHQHGFGKEPNELGDLITDLVAALGGLQED
jgi:hypothetical protein